MIRIHVRDFQAVKDAKRQAEYDLRKMMDEKESTMNLPPLPDIVKRAAHHYAGEGLENAVRAYATAAALLEREAIARMLRNEPNNYGAYYARLIRAR